MTHLAQDEEVRFVSGNAQHDQVGIQSIENVFGVGVPARQTPLQPDVFDHFVLPFPGNIRVR